MKKYILTLFFLISIFVIILYKQSIQPSVKDEIPEKLDAEPIEDIPVVPDKAIEEIPSDDKETNPPPVLETPAAEKEETPDSTKPKNFPVIPEDIVPIWSNPNFDFQAAIDNSIIKENNNLFSYVESVIKTAEAEPFNPKAEDGSTKYGELFDNPKAEWCTEFVMWCLFEAERELGSEYINKYYPWYDSGYVCVLWYNRHKRFYPSGTYIPKRGDMMFFDYDDDGNCDHTALVTGLEYDSAENILFVLTIEGNIPDDIPESVIRKRMLNINDKRIYGYGALGD